MTRDEIALQIFCAHLQRGGAVSITGPLGENEVKVAFTLADTFVSVMKEMRPPNPPPPTSDVGGVQKRGL